MRAALALALLASGCAPSAEVIVEVHTDLEPDVDFDRAEAASGAAEGGVSAAGGRFLAPNGVRLPALRVSEGPAEITAALTLGGDEVVARSVSIRAAGTIVVPVWLVRGCLDLDCPDVGDPVGWTECDGGRCVPPDCVPSETDDCGGTPCALDSDCPAAVADCASARCDRGACTFVPAGTCAASEYCDPSAGCVTRPTTADAGVRTDAGSSPCGSCDDGNGCTDDACEAGTCTHTPNGAGCSDGNDCTHSDHCEGGSCTGTGYSCSPPPCMTSSCDGSGGCSTGGGCGGGSVCSGGGCVACGAPDQPCCDGGGCSSGLWCFTGVCSCGQPGGPCCPWDGSCAAGSCSGGTCPTCTPDGGSCGSLPCCGTSRCASGICFPF